VDTRAEVVTGSANITANAAAPSQGTLSANSSPVTGIRRLAFTFYAADR
jgi:hypothetical protein